MIGEFIPSPSGLWGVALCAAGQSERDCERGERSETENILT
jgi:hypothetical protein